MDSFCLSLGTRSTRGLDNGEGVAAAANRISEMNKVMQQRNVQF